MKTVSIPISTLTDAEPITIVFDRPAGNLDLEEAVKLGEELFEILYARCPRILLRSLEQTLILHSPTIQSLAEKANKYDEQALQRTFYPGN